MTRTTGHLIRYTGLLIEMLGVWGVYNSYGQKDPAGIRLPGGDVVPWTWIVVTLGFAIWLTGTIIVFASRSPKRPLREDNQLG
jgi:hypothetical protein